MNQTKTIQRHASNHHRDQIEYLGNVIDLYLTFIKERGYEVILASFDKENSIVIQSTLESDLEHAEERYFKIKSALNLTQRPL